MALPVDKVNSYVQSITKDRLIVGTSTTPRWRSERERGKIRL